MHSGNNRSGDGPRNTGHSGWSSSDNTPARSASAERRDREAAEKERQAREESKRRAAEQQRLEAQRQKEERVRLEKERHEQWLAQQEVKRKQAEEAAKSPYQRRIERLRLEARQSFEVTLKKRAEQQDLCRQQYAESQRLREEKSKLEHAAWNAAHEKKRNDVQERCRQLQATKEKERAQLNEQMRLFVEARAEERVRAQERVQLQLDASAKERVKAQERMQLQLNASAKERERAREQLQLRLDARAEERAKAQERMQLHLDASAKERAKAREAALQKSLTHDTLQTASENGSLSAAFPAFAAGPSVGGLLTVAARGGQLALDACAKNPACHNNIFGRRLNGLFGASASAAAVQSLSDTQQLNVTLALMYGSTHQDVLAKLSTAERTAYDKLIADSKDSSINILPIPWNDPTEGKLVNPVIDGVGELSVSTPDQRGEQGAGHTGNIDGTPGTGITSTVTPIPDGINKVGSAYVSENQNDRDNLGNFTGQSGSPINVLPGENSPTTINGREYSAHAIDRMQGRGIPPSAVDNAIKTGTTYPTNPGTIGYFDPVNKLRVITNSELGAVVTVIPGAPPNEKK